MGRLIMKQDYSDSGTASPNKSIKDNSHYDIKMVFWIVILSVLSYRRYKELDKIFESSGGLIRNIQHIKINYQWIIMIVLGNMAVCLLFSLIWKLLLQANERKEHHANRTTLVIILVFSIVEIILPMAF